VRRIVNVAMSLLLVAGVAACQWRPPAATVGDTEITVAELDADVQMMREHPDLAAAFNLFLTPEGEPVPAAVTAQLLTLRIAEIVLAESYERSDNKLAADAEQELRDKIRAELAGALGSPEAVDELPSAFVQRLLDRFVHAEGLLGSVPEDEAQGAALALFDAFDIKVDSRFGTWDPEALEVTPNLPPGASDNPTLQTAEQ